MSFATSYSGEYRIGDRSRPTEDRPGQNEPSFAELGIASKLKERGAGSKRKSKENIQMKNIVQKYRKKIKKVSIDVKQRKPT